MENKQPQTKGVKLGLTQKFDQNGKRLPITRISADSITGFTVGDLVKVAGISKGKGFTGVVKRWGFKGGPKTHGQSDRQRHPGSIGQTTTPGRVYKGKKMAGRSGGQRVTIAGLPILAILSKEKQLWLKGPVPGPTNGRLEIRKAGQAKVSPLLDFAAKAEIIPDQEQIKQQQALEEKAKEAEDAAKTADSAKTEVTANA